MTETETVETWSGPQSDMERALLERLDRRTKEEEGERPEPVSMDEMLNEGVTIWRKGQEFLVRMPVIDEELAIRKELERLDNVNDLDEWLARFLPCAALCIFTPENVARVRPATHEELRRCFSRQDLAHQVVLAINGFVLPQAQAAPEAAGNG